MNLHTRIFTHFEESARAKHEAKQQLTPLIAQAIECMHSALEKGGKILICGNGGSAADAQHFSAELLNRFEKERPPLAGIALTTDSSTLTAIGNDYDFNQVFSKQIQALGRQGDVLFAISTSGNSQNILQAIEAAHALNMPIIAMTGRGGGKIASQLKPSDIHLCAPTQRTAHIQEIHLVILHCLCDGIDALYLKEE